MDLVKDFNGNNRPQTPFIGCQWQNPLTEKWEVYTTNGWKPIYTITFGELQETAIEGDSVVMNINTDAIITMGNIDISSLLNQGVLSIANVTNDVVITSINEFHQEPTNGES